MTDLKKQTKKVIMDGQVATFLMSVKGGKLPSNFEVYISVRMDFTDAKPLDMAICAASGSSARVQLQSQLRLCSVDDLNKWAKEGYSTTFSDVIAQKARPEPKPADLLNALSLVDFVEFMLVNYDIDEEASTNIWNRKHPAVDPTESNTEQEIVPATTEA